jgi:uncharacterized SAM-binding protein YcdF (DUF218 family)
VLGRLFSWLLLAALVGLLILLHPLWLSLAGNQLVADDPLQPSDAIVILAGNSPYRAQHAVDLYRAGWAPRLLVSDETVKTHGLATTWRALFEQGVAKLDVPTEAVMPLPGLAEDTRDEALKTRDMMVEHGWKRAIVVTDPFHSYRASLLFRAIFKAAGLEVRSSPALESPVGVRDWWRSTDGVERVTLEYVKLGWAASQGQL